MVQEFLSLKLRIEKLIAQGYQPVTISGILEREGIDKSPGEVWRIYVNAAHEEVFGIAA